MATTATRTSSGRAWLPQVSGLVALLRAVKPGIAAAKLIKVVKQTAGGCGTYAGGLGWGVIRSDRAVAAAAEKDVNPPSSNVRNAKVGHIPGRGRVAVLRLKRFDQGVPCATDIPISGIAAVNVFASANGGRYRRIKKTTKKKIRPGQARTPLPLLLRRRGQSRESRGAPPLADARIRLKK